MAIADSLPVCYLIMRNDLKSLGMGKGCAQAHHNGVAFATYMLDRRRSKADRALYREWASQTSQGYGTVLTLAADGDTMRRIVELAGKAGFASLVLNDPTYPLIDGKVCHAFPLDTCAYVFGRKGDLEPLLGRFPLFPAVPEVFASV